MAWERRHDQFYYYRKVREGGRVRSRYFGRGARAEAAARADGCAPPAGAPPLINSGGTVAGADTAPNQTAPCATPQLGEVSHKKEAGPWPAFLECLRATGDYRALALRYPAHTLPQPGESLTAWAERRTLALDAADGSTARMMG